MLKTRIAVLVSGGGTNLQALIDAEKDGILHSGEIVVVVSGNRKRHMPWNGRGKPEFPQKL